MTNNRFRYELVFSVHPAGGPNPDRESRENADDLLQESHRQIREILHQDAYRSFVNVADYQRHGDKGVIRPLGRLRRDLIDKLRGEVNKIASVEIKQVEARDRAGLRAEKMYMLNLEARAKDLPSFPQITAEIYDRPAGTNL